MGGRQMQQSDIYGGQDPREMPAYSIPEAAHYLQMPSSTLRWWVKGWTYRTDAGERFSAPLLTLPVAPERNPLLLSFVNIVEAHVLDALRRDHHVAMPKVREALSYLEAHFPSPHPLADQRFKTDGIHLFIERYGQLINISNHGQLAMDHVLRMYLSRIEHDPAGVSGGDPAGQFPLHSLHRRGPSWRQRDRCRAGGRKVERREPAGAGGGHSRERVADQKGRHFTAGGGAGIGR